MNRSKLFPLIITDKLDEIRAFYTDTLDCHLTHDMDAYVQVRFGEAQDAPELAFMTPEGGPPGWLSTPRFGGEGLIVSVPTQSADAHHDRIAKTSAPVVSAPSDKPWGWRSYAVQDPAGVVLDFFHELAKAAPVDATG